MFAAWELERLNREAVRRDDQLPVLAGRAEARHPRAYRGAGLARAGANSSSISSRIKRPPLPCARLM